MVTAWDDVDPARITTYWVSQQLTKLSALIKTKKNPFHAMIKLRFADVYYNISCMHWLAGLGMLSLHVYTMISMGCTH